MPIREIYGNNTNNNKLRHSHNFRCSKEFPADSVACRWCTRESMTADSIYKPIWCNRSGRIRSDTELNRPSILRTCEAYV